MERMDRKYTFEAVSLSSGKKHSHKDAIVFLVRDPAVPAMLQAYADECRRLGCDERQIESVLLLKSRVEAYQRRHPAKVKKGDVKDGREARRVCKPNLKAA